MDFFTVEALKTFAGQVAVILGAMQVLKQLWPSAPNSVKQWFTVALGVALQVAFVAWGGPIGGYVLAVINGGATALAAMKGYEMVKGTATKPRKGDA